MKEYMSINEFATEIGVSASTLRNWDRTGKLTPHHRTPGNQRVYSAEQANEYLGTDKVMIIQGAKGRDVYTFHYKDKSVTDKIGNRIYLQESPNGVQMYIIRRYIDELFHDLYIRSNRVDNGFRVFSKMEDTTWVELK